MLRRRPLALLIPALVLAACAGAIDVTPSIDALDAGPADAGDIADAGAADAGDIADAGAADAGDIADAGAADAGDTADAGPADAGDLSDAGAADAGTCGNGVVDPGEDCDFGAANGPGTGCESGCRFSCTAGSCAGTCAATSACAQITFDGGVGQQCQAGAPPPPCSPCADGLCVAGSCQPSACGDGCLDTGRGEQCDDGNLVNLDGCSAACLFEQDQRANQVSMQWSAGSFCTANALGRAVVNGQAQTTIEGDLSAGVDAGTLTIAFEALGLSDLTGADAPSFKLGAVSGAPYAAPPRGHYSGSSDLDWWYETSAADLDAERVPLSQLDASISAGALRAGPGHMDLALSLGSGLVQLAASGVRLAANVGPASAPLEAGNATPGHLASEHLDPSLVSFASLGGGQLCANVSAASLAQVPVPAALQSGGSTGCDQGYGAHSSMLDVLVGGCSVFGFVSVIAATQPDQVDPDAPPAGSGGPYRLSLSRGVLSSCRDVRGTLVDTATCLRAAAYSSFLTFSADRVVLK